MSDSSPLQRAHALSAQASLLLRPPNSHPQTSHQALEAYRQAAELFEQSGVTSGDDGAKKTLEMLTVQHRKLARDLERRIGGGLGGSPQRASSGFREGLPGASGGLFETAGGMNDAPAGQDLF